MEIAVRIGLPFVILAKNAKKIAVLKPAVDFQKLEDVLVITASREAPPAPLTPPVQTPGTETDNDGNFINGEKAEDK